MNEMQLKSIIQEVLKELNIKEDDIKNPRNPESIKSKAVENDSLKEEYDGESVTDYEMENFFAVPNPENIDAYKNYKKTTPARVGIWRAGPRYKTDTYLRFRADHAVAQDAVFTDVCDDFLDKKGWPKLKTLIQDKDEYITRPDLGRILDDESVAKLKTLNSKSPRVQVYIADGLSSTAVETNGYDALKSIEMGLKNHNIDMGTPFFLKYGRVPSMDHVSEITGAEVTALLIGERPGLATGESMSCYMIYRGKIGNPESARTVISNIHKNGTPAVEAGVHIADIIKKILDEKKSGVDLKL